MVEAAGVEPAPPQSANWLMACGSLSCCQFVVHWSALESSGILPSLGDILETESPTLPSRTLPKRSPLLTEGSVCSILSVTEESP